MTGRYDDIIDMQPPVSRRHKRMTMEQRAAQFAPFAAVTAKQNTEQKETQ